MDQDGSGDVDSLGSGPISFSHITPSNASVSTVRSHGPDDAVRPPTPEGDAYHAHQVALWDATLGTPSCHVCSPAHRMLLCGGCTQWYCEVCSPGGGRCLPDRPTSHACTRLPKAKARPPSPPPATACGGPWELCQFSSITTLRHHHITTSRHITTRYDTL